VDSTAAAILDTIRCLGGEKGIVYVTVPITTGLRELQLMRKFGCSRDVLKRDHPSDWMKYVKQPNEADAEAYALMVQLRYPDRLVLNPAALEVGTWSQDEYKTLWDDVIRVYCDTLVVTPDWAFSKGARDEVKSMVTYGRDVVDISGRRLTATFLRNADTQVRQHMEKLGWSVAAIDELLPPLGIEAPLGNWGGRPEPEWNRVASWVIRERRWQQRISDFEDDVRTRADGPRGGRGEWFTLMNKYFSRAQAAGVESDEGGMNLFIYVALAVAHLESVMEVYGAFPEAGRSTGDEPILGRIHPSDLEKNDRLALAIAWLRREYTYTSEKYPAEVDDENTCLGLGLGTWWDRQLKVYWLRAFERGLDTINGRQQLAKFAATAFNLAASRVRLYGVPSAPVRRTGEQLMGMSRANSSS
jgi:hypothetical protein